MITGVTDILLVVVIVGAAVAYLAWKGYKRVANKSAACGGCGGACEGEIAVHTGSNPHDSERQRSSNHGVAEPVPNKQVVQSIELLTIVTAEDRGL